MWNEKKIRIIDIADELGVSTATVSNVIHGKTKKISDATVRRVQEKLVERGYIPNMAATLLSQNNSRIVGVVVNNHPKYEGHVLEDPYISSAVNALSDALESHGYFLMLKKTSDIMDIVPFAYRCECQCTSRWHARCTHDEEKIRESYESGILSMVKSNNRITRKEMAEKLSISLRSLQRIINEMDELHYVGSGNHGHWEIKHDQY